MSKSNRLVLLAFAMLLPAGCSSSLPPETDASKGRELLKVSLDAWKRGDAMDQLAKGSPSIITRDPDWKAGLKLANYEIENETDRAGVDLLLTVKLSVVRADGKPVDKKVKFTVGMGSANVVMRNE